jgi:hypothetical protein
MGAAIARSAANCPEQADPVGRARRTLVDGSDVDVDFEAEPREGRARDPRLLLGALEGPLIAAPLGVRQRRRARPDPYGRDVSRRIEDQRVVVGDREDDVRSNEGERDAAAAGEDHGV